MIKTISGVVIALTCGGLLSFTASAAEQCPLHNKAVNDSNAIIMLGGTARGPIKQVVVGEFGKDVDLQKRLLGQFDNCGILLIADSSFDKNEGNVLLNMEQHVVRIPGGWQADYAISVKVKQQEKMVEVSNKQGTINYQLGKNGNITSSTDVFTLMGKKGFTETTYSHDRHFRLLKSVARGSDHLSNGEYRYQWDPKGNLLTTTSDKSKETYTYDKQERELGLHSVASTAVSTITTIHECQSWDDIGNCTLSYGRETEVFDSNTVKRNISTAYRFEYWPKEAQ
ncbi:hypothetical protein N5923_17300 [Erwiniaceae bacterium BAC15a-03b]|uniref:YD repeat-containing protein n=1 Tax=Winslowiella arboricola TaxID=2978220 RepID=A0A9J6PP93_9GAMM|nr:hypothetical protein [Winslowiella arboricola]MCU5775907.1 hypothetical protein [Winslowiella arboricola]MCU5779242.1 hypothetical protein [Winslowiella arboricola]